MIGANIGLAAGIEHRKQPVLAYRFVDRRDQVFFGDGALAEVLLHQLVLALGNQLHQRLVGGLRIRRHRVRDLSRLAAPAAVRLVQKRRHRHQVHYAVEAVLVHNRQLHGNHLASPPLLKLLDHVLPPYPRVGFGMVHLVHHQDARQV